MPIWESVSVVPTGIGSVFGDVPRTYVLGCKYAAPAGLGLAGESRLRTSYRGALHFGNKR
jgi:hypothetical protein